MMQDLREKTKIVMIVVAVAFVGLMVFEWGMDISGRSVGMQTGELGRVNGAPVQAQAYSLAYQQLYDQARVQSGGNLSREQVRALEDQAFNEIVNQVLIRQEMRRRGIRVTDAEVRQAAQWSPHPDLMNNELFLTNGQFDISKYQQFLAGPQANEELLLQLEQYYRETIPQAKLMRQITAGLYVSDAELWQIWKDRNESATVDYVALDVAQLVPGDVPVSEDEVQAYYRANPDEFERGATGRFTVAVIPKAVTAQDSAAALARAEAVRAEIVGGADFAEVARRESIDPGSAAAGGQLGPIVRGQTALPFEEAAFSLPAGELSQPVLTQFGYHLLEVQARDTAEATVRHILLPVGITDESLDRLYARADSLEDLAERGGLERAARAVGARVQQGVVVSEDAAFVPGIGSALEAIEWAEDEELLPEEERQEVSPVFETPEALFLVQLETPLQEAGRTPLAEAAPQIRRQLIAEKRRAQARAIGQEMVAAVRGGQSLEQVAQARGLSVESVGPFVRAGFNPVFGQANAVIGASFGTPIGQVSDVVESSAGLFIVRPTERVEANRQVFEAAKEQLRQAADMQIQQDAVTRWLEELRAEAEIIDRREEVFRAAAQAPPMAL